LRGPDRARRLPQAPLPDPRSSAVDAEARAKPAETTPALHMQPPAAQQDPRTSERNSIPMLVLSNGGRGRRSRLRAARPPVINAGGRTPPSYPGGAPPPRPTSRLTPPPRATPPSRPRGSESTCRRFALAARGAFTAAARGAPSSQGVVWAALQSAPGPGTDRQAPIAPRTSWIAAIPSSLSRTVSSWSTPVSRGFRSDRDGAPTGRWKVL
jgi:hypothetical protein